MKQETKQTLEAFLWWVDTFYYRRGMMKNQDGKYELHWSNHEESKDLWDMSEASIYTAVELIEKFKNLPS